MAYGTRWTRPLAGAALTLTAALAAAGCSSTPAASTAAGAAGTGAPAVTTAQARQVFGSYVASAGQAAVSGDTSLALSSVTDVQKQTVDAELKAAKDGVGGLTRYRFGTPTFYLTQPDGYPRWFVASVRRTLIGQPGIPGGTAGAALPATGQVLMLFEQNSSASPWLLASSSQLAPGETVPPLAVSSAGYVATVPLSSGAQLARPDLTGPLQAAVVDDGPASAAAKVVAAGNLTTGIYDAARSPATGLTAPPGDIYQWELEGSGYAQWALRTADGGALVFYPMYLNSTVEVPALLNKGVVSPGPVITVPSDVDFLLSPTGSAPRERLITQQVLSFAAVDPPAGGGKIQVIAVGGGLDYADAG